MTLAAILAMASHLAPEPVRYQVDLSRVREQVLTVRMTLPAVNTPSIDVHLPVWRPGLYLVLDQAGTVRSVRASGKDNAPLEINKIEKSSWRVVCSGEGPVTVEYELWAASLDNRTRHADDTHAFLNPATVFMYNHERRASPILVDFVGVPEGQGPTQWRIASGLPSAGPFSLSAMDYDRLADSPIEVGVHHRLDFDVDGTPHEIIVWTGEPTLESSWIPGRAKKWGSLAADFAAITRAQRDVFGRLPYERYVFLIHCYPGGRGGTEHYNSTIMQCPPEALHDPERYRSFLSLTSHELFHTWNVKRFRPAEMTPYDYQRENLTTLLWVAEGTTTYYEDLILVRAGLLDAEKFLATLAEWIQDDIDRPGSGVQSVASSSYDAWVKFNKRTADAPNSTVSFYDKGALISLALDMELRSRGSSLDRVMRLLYERFPEPDRGFTERDLIAAVADAAGDPVDAPWLRDFFRDHVHGTVRPDFARLLGVVGVQVQTPDPAGELKPWAGFTLADEVGLARVTGVSTGGPAAQAGVVPGDLVVALNGRRVRAADWPKVLESRGVGEQVELAVFRHDVLRAVRLELGGKPDGKVKLSIDSKAEGAPSEQRSSWLGSAGTKNR